MLDPNVQAGQPGGNADESASNAATGTETSEAVATESSEDAVTAEGE